MAIFDFSQVSEAINLCERFKNTLNNLNSAVIIIKFKNNIGFKWRHFKKWFNYIISNKT